MTFAIWIQRFYAHDIVKLSAICLLLYVLIFENVRTIFSIEIDHTNMMPCGKNIWTELETETKTEIEIEARVKAIATQMNFMADNVFLVRIEKFDILCVLKD